MSKVSLWTNLYIPQKDQVFIADVVVINLMWEMVFLNVINWPPSVAMKFIVIAKICKYEGLREGHHFLPMTMEVHDALKHDMDHFIRECACLFHNR